MGRLGFEGVDVGGVAEGEADVVEAFEQAVVVEVAEVERLVEVDRGDGDAPVDDVDHDLDRRVVLDRPHDPRDHLGRAAPPGAARSSGSCCGRCRRSAAEMTARKP